MKKYMVVIKLGIGVLYGPFPTAKDAEKWLRKTRPDCTAWSLEPVYAATDDA